MVQHHDSVPSLNCTAISIDSPHMHRDGANYLNLLLLSKSKDKIRFMKQRLKEKCRNRTRVPTILWFYSGSRLSRIKTVFIRVLPLLDILVEGTSPLSVPCWISLSTKRYWFSNPLERSDGSLQRFILEVVQLLDAQPGPVGWIIALSLAPVTSYFHHLVAPCVKRGSKIAFSQIKKSLNFCYWNF